MEVSLEYPFKTITIKIIPKGLMRHGWDYGDYFMDEKGGLQIRVSEFENPDHAFRIIMHELAESWRFARKNGCDFSPIDKFDIEHQETDEPGRMKCSPYHKEHMQSEEIERLLCHQDGESWDIYYNSVPKGV